jgi:hypothetical protein
VTAARRLGSVALVASLLLLPTLAYGAGYDHGFLQYLGRTVLQGRWPYVGAFDTSFPGAILFHAAVIAVGGESILALRVADLLVQVATAVLLYRRACRVAGARAGYIAAAMYAIAYTQAGYYDTAQRDGYIAIFLLAALGWLWQFLDDPAHRGPLIWSAVALGLAALIRPTYALLAALGALALALRSGRRQHRIREAAVFALVAALPIVAFFAVYLLSHHGRALADVLLYDATVYPAIERGTPLYVLRRLATSVPFLVWVGTALAIIAAARGAWADRRREIATLILMVAGCVLIRLWEMKGWRYQYWPLVVLLAVSAGMGWSWLIDRVAPRRAALRAIIILAIAGAQLGVHGLARYRAMWSGIHPTGTAVYAHLIADSHDQAALAEYLATHMRSRDSIQMWGPETIVLFTIDRPSATRFIDPLVFVCPDPANPHHSILFTDCGPRWHKPVQIAFRRELTDALAAHPPQYIAAHYADGTLAIDTTYSLAPDLPELRSLIDHRYTRAATFGPWSVFRRTDY